jgi:hypothetical protein
VARLLPFLQSSPGSSRCIILLFLAKSRNPGYREGRRTRTAKKTAMRGVISLSGTAPVPCTRTRTRTRTNTNPNGTEANAAGRCGNARAVRKQSKCGMSQEGEGHWPNSSIILQKARYLWVLRTPQNNKEEGARARKLVACGTRGSLCRGQSVPFSAQGTYCSAPEP